jgi:hypothetical protein
MSQTPISHPEFDFEPAKAHDLVSTPQGEFDFEVTSDAVSASVEPDIINSTPVMDVDEMLTIEARRAEKERSDRIKDFVNKQFNGMKLSGGPPETTAEKIQREFEQEALGSKKPEQTKPPMSQQPSTINFDFDFNQPPKLENNNF